MNINWIFAFFLLLILCSIKRVDKQGGEASVYTRPVSNSIKGVAAILIVLHHIAWKLEEANIIVWFYREINLFAVGVFLFFSGFGLLKSYEARGGVLKGRELSSMLPDYCYPILRYLCLSC